MRKCLQIHLNPSCFLTQQTTPNYKLLSDLKGLLPPSGGSLIPIPSELEGSPPSSPLMPPSPLSSLSDFDPPSSLSSLGHHTSEPLDILSDNFDNLPISFESSKMEPAHYIETAVGKALPVLVPEKKMPRELLSLADFLITPERARASHRLKVTAVSEDQLLIKIEKKPSFKKPLSKTSSDESDDNMPLDQKLKVLLAFDSLPSWDSYRNLDRKNDHSSSTSSLEH